MASKTKLPRRRFIVPSIWNVPVEVKLSRNGGSTQVDLVWKDTRTHYFTAFVAQQESATIYRLTFEQRSYPSPDAPDPVPDWLERIEKALPAEPWFIHTGGRYALQLHLRWDNEKAYGGGSWIERNDLHLLPVARTGTWSALTSPFATDAENFPFFTEENAREVVDAINAFHAYHGGGEAWTQPTSQAQLDRYEKQRRALGTERVLLGQVGMALIDNGTQNRTVNVYGFPRSGTDMLELTDANDRHIGFVDGAEVAARWTNNRYDGTYVEGSVLVYRVQGRSRFGIPGYWADANVMFGLLMELRRQMMTYGSGPVPAFPFEVQVLGKNDFDSRALTYLAEYDGKSKAGVARIKLTYVRGPWRPSRSRWVIYAHAHDGFTVVHALPTKVSPVDLQLTDDARSQILVALDNRYEQGLHGLSAAPGTSLTLPMELVNFRPPEGLYPDGRTAPGEVTFEVVPGAVPEVSLTNILATYRSRVGNTIHWGYVSAADLRSAIENNELRRLTIESPRRLRFTDDALAQLNVWLDSLQERGLAEVAW